MSRVGLPSLQKPSIRITVAMVALAVVGGAGFLLTRALTSANVPSRANVELLYLLRATSDDGLPLQGVELTLDARTAAFTDELGEAWLPLSGPVGAIVPLAVKCPTTHHGEPTLPPVVMRKLQSLSDAHAQTKQAVAPVEGSAPVDATAAAATTPEGHTPNLPSLEATVSCDRGVRRAAVVVRAQLETTTVRVDRKQRTVERIDLAPLPALVKLDGKAIAETDASGIAHIALERPPGSKLEFVLEPQGGDELALTPVSLPFDVADVDDTFVFDRTFAHAVEIQVRHARRSVKKRPRKIREVEASEEPFLELR